MFYYIPHSSETRRKIRHVKQGHRKYKKITQIELLEMKIAITLEGVDNRLTAEEKISELEDRKTNREKRQNKMTESQ